MVPKIPPLVAHAIFLSPPLECVQDLGIWWCHFLDSIMLYTYIYTPFQTQERYSLAGFKKRICYVWKSHMARTGVESRCWEQPLVNSQQEKEGHRWNHKDLKSASLHEFGRRPWAADESTTGAPPFWSETLSREPTPGHLTYRDWDTKNGCHFKPLSLY